MNVSSNKDKKINRPDYILLPDGSEPLKTER